MIVAGAVIGGIWWMRDKGMLPPPEDLLNPAKNPPVVETTHDPDDSNESDPPNQSPRDTQATTGVRTNQVPKKIEPPTVGSPRTPPKTPIAVKPSIAVPQGTDKLRFANHKTTVVDFSLSADGESLATAGPAGDCRVWNVSTGETTAQFSGHEGLVHSVAFASRGNQDLSSGETLKLWNSQRAKNSGS